MLAKMVSTPDYLAFLEATGAEAPGPKNVGGYNGFWITPGDALAQMNGKYRTSLIVDPPDGQIPWREEGQAVRRSQQDELPMGMAESDGPEGRTLSDRCLISFASTAPFMSSLYNNHMQIVQGPTHVVLLAEMVHNARIVRIDQEFKELPFDKWLGDSIGYYEGDTLIVQTKKFNGWQVANARFRVTASSKCVTQRQMCDAGGETGGQRLPATAGLFLHKKSRQKPNLSGGGGILIFLGTFRKK